MVMSELQAIPTFQRLQSNSTVIDYIYAGNDIHHNLKDTHITHLHHKWSDHSVLYISFVAGRASTGPGLWRANPIYASHPALKPLLTAKITDLVSTLAANKQLTAADKSDRVKLFAKKVIRNYSYSYVDWRKASHARRNHILRGKPPLAI
ncbi:hypothetical protein RMATCC62417_17171 [Rhizopus microsporus]|nr:hypothetical protein RMATCC62417_17171 [Rhizopus microsporus]